MDVCRNLPLFSDSANDMHQSRSQEDAPLDFSIKARPSYRPREQEPERNHRNGSSEIQNRNEIIRDRYCPVSDSSTPHNEPAFFRPRLFTDLSFIPPMSRHLMMQNFQAMSLASTNPHVVGMSRFSPRGEDEVHSLNIPPEESQSPARKWKKKKSAKGLRPHEVTQQLLERPVHRAKYCDLDKFRDLDQFRDLDWYEGVQANFDNGQLSSPSGSSFMNGFQPVLNSDTSSYYSGSSNVPVCLSYGSGITSLSDYLVRGSSPTQDCPSKVERGPPFSSRFNQFRREELSPTRDGPIERHTIERGPSSSRNSLFSSRLSVSLNGPSSPKKGLSPSQNVMLSPKRGSSPVRNTSSSSGMLPASLNGLSSKETEFSTSRNEKENPPPNRRVSRDSLSSSGKGESSSQDGSSSLDKDQSPSNPTTPVLNDDLSPQDQSQSSTNGQSSLRPHLDSNQNSLLDKMDMSSSDVQLSPDESGEMGRYSPVSPFGTADSSSGSLFPKRKKGNPVPEAEKDQNYLLKRMKNNVAAKKSREKRRQHENELTEKARVLFVANAELKTENDQLLLQVHTLETERMLSVQKMKEEQQLRLLAESRLKKLASIIKSCRQCSKFVSC